MQKFDLFRRVRNAAGQPRPVDVAALAGLDADRLINYADGLLLTAEDRGQGLPDEDAQTFTELVKQATDSIEAARTAADKDPQTSKNRKNAGDALHAALVALGDLALMLEAAGLARTDAKNGLDPRAIYERRRRGTAR